MTALIWLTLSWTIGIILARYLDLPLALIGWGSIPIMAGVWLYRHEAKPRFLAINGLFILLGMVRLWWANPTIDAGHVAFYNESGSVTLQGQIVAEPDIRDNYINLQINAETLITSPNQPSQTVPVQGLVLVQTPRYPEYQYGDRLTIRGKLETPPIFNDFSYRDYLARKNIHALVRRPRIEAVEPIEHASFYARLFHWKANASEIINDILPEPEASLLNGILLGIRSGIPSELYEEFNKTGASHVIVISGSNIALVMALLLLVGQRLVGKRYAAIIAIGGIILYTVLVGADASVTRAALMGSIYAGAIFFGRSNNVTNALFVAAFIMTIVNPLVLWDVGFQLSFMATFGLILLVPLLEQHTSQLLGQTWSKQAFQSFISLIREVILVTIAAQIMVTPLLLYHFDRLTVVGLLTNLLIVPVQPLVMIFGTLATVGGIIYSGFGQILGWFVWLPLTWTVSIVRWTAGFAWAEVELPEFPLWLMILCYACIATTIWWLYRPDVERPTLPTHINIGRGTVFSIGGMALIAILTWSATIALPDGKLHIAFLDVGQGDAIFITTPNGRQILIDGGPSAAQLGYRLGDEMPFWDRSIDMIINTHPDTDHLGGLVEIIERYQVDNVLVSNAESHSSLQQEWLTQLKAHQHTPILAWQNMILQLDTNVQALVLNPGQASQHAESDNNRSVVLKITMGKVSFLLTGDIEVDIERALASSGVNLQATVLKSPHHGSQTSSSSSFLDKVNPQIVVISAGEGNRFGHPHQVVLDRYTAQNMTVLRTDQSGTVEIITDGENVWVDTR